MTAETTPDLPDVVATEIRRLCVDSRRPAFLLITRDGLLADMGGDCGRYGLGDLQKGVDACEQIDLLTGLLPVDGERVFLPFIQVTPELFVDLYLFPECDGDCVLLLDATATAHRFSDMQQNSNELSLLRGAQARLISQIQRHNEELLSIFNQLQVATAIVDKNGVIEFLSERGQRLFASDRQGFVGRHWSEVLPVHGQEKACLAALLTQPKEDRARLSIRTGTNRGPHYCLELDVQDHHRDPQKRILYMYDVSEVYDLRQLLKEKSRFHELVGKSKPMAQVFQLIRDVSEVTSTVLIEGETGTGKELVARAIHSSSGRSNKPFIVVNCAGLSDSLINSQLFGHKKGAFTDAVSDQQGFFEAAASGTILLDEIGDIPMNTQTRILRTLEQKEITRIGETKPTPVDVRILAATNKDLTEEVRRGSFRMDLLYRIRVIRIELPPLRERTEDIPLLVEEFMTETRALTGKDVDEIDSSTMRMLMDYRWPGNVRELRNAIESAIVCCKGAILQPNDLPPELRGASAGMPGRRRFSIEDERGRILDALEKAHGKRGEAAKLLGIGRATLYRRMKVCFMNPADIPG